MRMKSFLGILIFTIALLIPACGSSNNADSVSNSSDSENISSSSSGRSTHKHTYSEEWSYDDTYHWHDATCEHDVKSNKGQHTFEDWIIDEEPSEKEGGKQHKSCQVCGYRVDETMPAIGSKDKLTISEDGTITFKRRDIDGDIVIPSVLNDIEVKTIGDFNRCFNITSITILDGPTSVNSNSFYECDSLESVILSDSIQTIGSGAFYGCHNLESVVLPKNLTSIPSELFYDCRKLKSANIPDKVTTIGDSAFSGCNSLELTTIPNSVTSIGEEAFSNCCSIKSLTISENVRILPHYVFASCTSLESIQLPNKLTSIKDSAFQSCESLKSINIPDSVTSIGKNSFYCCTSLESITFGKGLTAIPEYAFQDCKSLKTLIIPNNIASIGECAFSDCPLIRELVFSASLESIGPSAFAGCYNLERVVLLNPSTSVDPSAFGGCYRLVQTANDINETIIHESEDGFVTAVIEGKNTLFNYVGNQKGITIPSTIEVIKDYAFYNCEITSVRIPQGVLTIGRWAFEECYTLEEITVDANNPNYASYQGILYNKDLNEFRCIPKGINGDIDVHSGVTTIGTPLGGSGDNPSFAGCRYLKSVNLPSSVTAIGLIAFRNCQSMTSISIPDSVTTIDSGAFSYCYSLTSIKMPQYFRFLGVDINRVIAGMFEGCYSLTSLIVATFGEVVYNPEIDGLHSLTEIILEESQTRLSRDENGFITMVDGTDKVLVKYVGGQKELVIPNDINVIRDYALFFGSENVARSKITSLTISNSVRSIGYSCCDFCDELKTLYISDSVKTIGDRAFVNCLSLESVYIGTGLMSLSESLFANCRKLTEVTIKANITSIGRQAFEGCPFTSIDLPSSVTIIGIYAFNLCTNLESITIPQNTTIIEEHAFYCCYALREVIFNNKLQKIGSYAFGQCPISSVSLPDSLTELGDYPFYACERITSLTVGGGLQTVKELSFASTYSLRTLVIKNGVKTIESYAFTGEHLDYVIIPKSITTIKEFAFGFNSDYIFYEGNAQEWSRITIEDFNFVLTDPETLYFYSETTPTGEGNYWHYVNGNPVPWN